MNGSTVTLPKKLFEDLIQAADYFDQIQSELEDFMLSRDAQFLARMRKMRREHAKGRFADWTKLKARYGIPRKTLTVF